MKFKLQMIKLKNQNCYGTQKLKLGQNLKNIIVMKLKKTHIVMKLKYSNCDKTKNSICDKTQKLKLWWNSKLKLWWNSKTQIVIKHKITNSDTTQKLKTLLLDSLLQEIK